MNTIDIEYYKTVYPLSANSETDDVIEAGLIKILSEKETGTILSVHIIGANAGELINEGVLSIEYGASVHDVSASTSSPFAEACKLHATSSSNSESTEK